MKSKKLLKVFLMNKTIVIKHRDTYLYTFWHVPNASSINDLIYLSSSRKEFFFSTEDAAEYINKIKQFFNSVKNDSIKNELALIVNELTINEFSYGKF